VTLYKKAIMNQWPVRGSYGDSKWTNPNGEPNGNGSMNGGGSGVTTTTTFQMANGKSPVDTNCQFGFLSGSEPAVSNGGPFPNNWHQQQEQQIQYEHPSYRSTGASVCSSVGPPNNNNNARMAGSRSNGRSIGILQSTNNTIPSASSLSSTLSFQSLVSRNFGIVNSSSGMITANGHLETHHHQQQVPSVPTRTNGVGLGSRKRRAASRSHSVIMIYFFGLIFIFLALLAYS